MLVQTMFSTEEVFISSVFYISKQPYPVVNYLINKLRVALLYS